MAGEILRAFRDLVAIGAFIVMFAFFGGIYVGII